MVHTMALYAGAYIAIGGFLGLACRCVHLPSCVLSFQLDPGGGGDARAWGGWAHAMYVAFLATSSVTPVVFLARGTGETTHAGTGAGCSCSVYMPQKEWIIQA